MTLACTIIVNEMTIKPEIDWDKVFWGLLSIDLRSFFFQNLNIKNSKWSIIVNIFITTTVIVVSSVLWFNEEKNCIMITQRENKKVETILGWFVSHSPCRNSYAQAWNGGFKNSQQKHIH